MDYQTLRWSSNMTWRVKLGKMEVRSTTSASFKMGKKNIWYWLRLENFDLAIVGFRRSKKCELANVRRNGIAGGAQMTSWTRPKQEELSSCYCLRLNVEAVHNGRGTFVIYRFRNYRIEKRCEMRYHLLRSFANSDYRVNNGCQLRRHLPSSLYTRLYPLDIVASIFPI